MPLRRPISVVLLRQLMKPVFPAIVLLTFLVMATGLKIGLDTEENTQIRQTLAQDTEALASRLEQDFLNHVIALRRMANRLEVQPDLPQAVWREDARQYLQDFQTFQAIEWIDRNLVIHWVEPMAGNEAALGYNAGFNPKRRRELKRAQQEGSLNISGVIRLTQGGPGLVVYAPVGAGDANNGFIAGVFRMERLADA